VAATTTEAKVKELATKAVEGEREAKIATKKAIAKVEATKQRAVDEVVAKVVEEEKRKKGKEALNNDASPMDNDLLKTSTEVPSNQLQTNRMELGLSTPYKPNKVANLKKFRYDKATGRIVQQQVKKVLVTGGNPLVVIKETNVMEDVS
jgi:hypothetical protein